MNPSAESAEKQPWISQRMIKDRKSKLCPSSRHGSPSGSVCKTSVLLHLYTQKAQERRSDQSLTGTIIWNHSLGFFTLTAKLLKDTMRLALGQQSQNSMSTMGLLNRNSNCVIMELLIKTLSASEELSVIHKQMLLLFIILAENFYRYCPGERDTIHFRHTLTFWDTMPL